MLASLGLFFFWFLLLSVLSHQPLREELLKRCLLLGSTGGFPLLGTVEFVEDGAVGRHEFVGGVQVVEGRLVVLQADVGETAAVERLGAIRVFDFEVLLVLDDHEGVVGGAEGIVPSLGLDVDEGGVVVEGESEDVELGLERGAFSLGEGVEFGFLVEVADALLVLLQG